MDLPPGRGNTLLIGHLQQAGLTEEERNALEMLYRAFNEQKPELLDEACASDRQDIPLAPGQEPGSAGLKKMLPVFFSAFLDFKLEIHEVVVSNRQVTVRGSLVGKHRGNLFVVRATNETVDIPFCELHHFRQGRITHTYPVEDWISRFLRLGHRPYA